MSLEGWSIRALQEELQVALTDSKVDRVFQHNATELSLEIHKQKSPMRLLISIHPQFARVQLITSKRKNPPVPPSFCQLLRRRLEGARFISVEQPGLERMLIFNFAVLDELGNPDQLRFIVELMGKNSNLILCDRDFLILDAMKHVPGWQNRYREILPGRAYIRPPKQDKQDFSDWIIPTGDRELALSVSDWLKKNIDGVGNSSVNALLTSLSYSSDQMSAFLSEDHWSKLKDQSKTAVQERQLGCLFVSNCNSDILPFHFANLSGEWRSASEALEADYLKMEQVLHLQHERHRLTSILNAAIQKGRKKLFALEEDLQQGKDADQYRIWGELLKNTAEPLIREDEIQVINYYDENLALLSIPLDVRLSVAQNAQNYFKRYSKARKGEKIILEQIEVIKAEVAYFESILIAVELTEDVKAFLEIQEELIAQGLMAPVKMPGKAKKPTKPTKAVAHEPLHLQIEGVAVSVGRNNLQNDYLTMELAKGSDWWFHSKEVPGSHVVVHIDKPSDRLYELAAALAAWFSQARSSSYVAIDYTQKKHVKKFKGAKPGAVHYTDFFTLYVAPRSPDEVLRDN
jgi:predicted ribosome quality control (RQC) complex YloA/Tae2 family protein